MKTRDRREGITLVHTGEGKGKSSSGFGVVFRAAGWGLKVCVIQLIKGKWKTGESQAAERWDTKNPEKDIQTSREVWEFAKEKIRSEEFDLVMLDEINYCCGYGWFTGEEIATFIKEEKPEWMHLILTGRDAPQEVIDVADTVTDMRKVKHAFDSGILAAQGVEF